MMNPPRYPLGILTPSAFCSRSRSSTIRRACSGMTIGFQSVIAPSRRAVRLLRGPTEAHN
jgi:hypothetical protein